jgi:uncharacterized membrane protein YkoI
MIYEVEFELEGVEYEYKINAKSGEILKSKIEDDDDDDDEREELPENILSREDAISAALAAAGVEADDTTVIECELEHKLGRFFYEIEIKKDGAKNEIYVDAVSGEIIESITKPSEDENKPSHDDDDDDDDDDRDDHKNNASDNAEGKGQRPTDLLGKAAAIEAALAAANISEADAREIDCDLEHKWGKWFYEIEIETADGESEIYIDAQSGEVLTSKGSENGNKAE